MLLRLLRNIQSPTSVLQATHEMNASVFYFDSVVTTVIRSMWRSKLDELTGLTSCSLSD